MITEELTVVATRLSQYAVEADLQSPLHRMGIVPDPQTRLSGTITVVGKQAAELKLGQRIKVTLEPVE